METDRDRLRGYYSEFEEWKRKDCGSGRLEFERGLEIIESTVDKPARLLDLGGGEGRYAICLAKRGYRVTLADLSPTLLDRARVRAEASEVETRIESFDEVDATDLSRYADDSFDAVIAYGPFYHLLGESERASAAAEIARVTRDGGAVLAAFIPWQSGVSSLIYRAAHAPDQVDPQAFEQAFHTGVFRNAADQGFQEGYYARPEEIEHLFVSVGFETSRIVSLRGLADTYESLLERLDEARTQSILKAVRDSAEEPSVVASCGHAVYVATR